MQFISKLNVLSQSQLRCLQKFIGSRFLNLWNSYSSALRNVTPLFRLFFGRVRLSPFDGAFKLIVSSYMSILTFHEWAICGFYQSTLREAFKLSLTCETFKLSSLGEISKLSPSGDTFKSSLSYGSSQFSYLFRCLLKDPIHGISYDPTKGLIVSKVTLRYQCWPSMCVSPWERRIIWWKFNINIAIEDFFSGSPSLILHLRATRIF